MKLYALIEDYKNKEGFLGTDIIGVFDSIDKCKKAAVAVTKTKYQLKDNEIVFNNDGWPKFKIGCWTYNIYPMEYELNKLDN